MGGQSSSQQTQSSTTAPWQPAQQDLTGILGQIGSGLGNTGLTGTEGGALNKIVSDAGAQPNYAPGMQANVASLVNGGGALNQAGAVNQNYQDYAKYLTPFANGSMVGQNPALQAQLQQIQTDVGNSVNGQFAAAGRDFSGANQQAYGRGVASGEAPVIAGQYNQDVANQLGAANGLFNGGNASSALLAGLQQQAVANQQLAPQAATDAMNAQNAPQNAILQAEAARRGIPVQALGLLAQIGIPIAGLGGQSTGQAQGTQQMSGAQQFGLISGGIGNLFHSFVPGGL